MLAVSSWLWWTLGLAVAAAAAFYGGLPLVIKRTLTVKGRPTIQPIKVGEMPPAVYAHFGRSAVGLQACGFTIKTYVMIPDQVPNVHAYVAMWINEAAGQQATATVLYGHDDAGRLTARHYVEFMTKVGGEKDGVAVLTNNSQELGAFRETSNKSVLFGVPTENIAQLYRVHLYREAEHLRADDPRYVPDAGDEVASLADGIEADLRKQVAAGYLVEDANTPNLFRPTTWGAYVMTWSQMPPLKSNLKLAADYRAKKALHEAMQHPIRPPQNVPVTHKSPFILPPRRLPNLAA
jgi:hypothetical protein